MLVKAYAEWGTHCVQRFAGMFAVAERDSGRLVLARDRLRIKPLYLNSAPSRLRFASTLPALLAGGDVETSIDATALHHYLSFHSVVPPPRTIYIGVRKLPPGHRPHRRTRRDDQRPPILAAPVQPPPARSVADDWPAALLDALRLAVPRRMVADVPVGVLPSGGLDSSPIVALLADGGQTDLRTFSIGFEAAGGEDGDEFGYSDLVAAKFATRHSR